MSLRELQGEAVSPGIAIGPVCWLHPVGEQSPPICDDGNGHEHLRRAIAVAVGELNTLMAVLKDDERALIEFQVAMLEDDALTAPVFQSIDEGNIALAAWNSELSRQIEGYQSSDDPYFKARAADLVDIRDRVGGALSGTNTSDASVPEGAVFAGRDLTPSRFLQTDWRSGGGVVLSEGSSMSHVAILARARGVPMVVGVKELTPAENVDIALDGETGEVFVDPDAATRDRIHARRHHYQRIQDNLRPYLVKDAITADGRRIDVFINVAHPSDVDEICIEHCDGIGLMRSEFLFTDQDELPDEDQQFAVYCRLLHWAGDKPVTIRTLDAGGDKPIENFTFPQERNPFLGLRGIRLSFARPDSFMAQCRALCRAAVHGQLKVMFPMVATAAEFARAAAFIDAAVSQLESEDKACRKPELGMMVEIPAAAIGIEKFDQPDFFSVGSNDLLQYLSAASRDDERLREIADACEPELLTLVAHVAKYAKMRGQDLSLCGDIAGDVAKLPALLHAGLSALSVSPAGLGRVKAAIAEINGNQGLDDGIKHAE